MLNEEYDEYKKQVFQFLLLFTIISISFFIYVNSSRQQYALATVELFIVISSLIILFYIRRPLNILRIKALAFVYVIMFFSIMMFAFATKGISNSAFIWVNTVPLISYLLLGTRAGFGLTIIYYSIATVLFVNFQEDFLMSNPITPHVNIIFSSLLFWGLSHSYEKSNQNARNELRKIATIDSLTDIYNRSMLKNVFAVSLTQAQKEHQMMSLIVFDLDRFKSINDQYGHSKGDEVLIKFTKILKTKIPQRASAFRMGGEEFAIIFPCESIDSSVELAESLRIYTQNISVSSISEPIQITVSAGIAICKPENANLENLITLADKRLYIAKNQGRNIVVSEG